MLYFSRWIERSVPGVRVILETGAGERGIRAVTLSGKDAEATVTLMGGGSLEVRAGGRMWRSPMPASDDDSLMQAELSILEADPAFELVLK